MANMGFNVVLLNVFTLVCNFCIFTAYANTAQPEVLAIRLEKTDAKSTYSEDGIVTPITLVKVEECIVSAIKTKD